MIGNYMFLFCDVAEEGTKEGYTVIRKAMNICILSSSNPHIAMI